MRRERNDGNDVSCVRGLNHGVVLKFYTFTLAGIAG